MGAESKNNRLEIAKRIKKARKDAGLTQAEVARKLGLTPQAISNYERGINGLPAGLLFELSDLYGLSEFSFLDGLPEPYQVNKEFINPVQYDILQYQFEINDKLCDATEIEQRDIIQEEIKKIKPNETEWFLAQKLRYGSRPEKGTPAPPQSEIDMILSIMDAVSIVAIHYKDTKCRKISQRIDNLITLLQAFEKVKNGVPFEKEGPFDPPRSDLHLSDTIKKQDVPPGEDYISKSVDKDGNVHLVLHEVEEHPNQK